jgi:hypothetical protein
MYGGRAGASTRTRENLDLHSQSDQRGGRTMRADGTEPAERAVAPVPRRAHASGVAFFLLCAECQAVTDVFERGWRAYYACDEPRRDLVFFCPACAEREFGEDAREALGGDQST